MKKVAIVYWPKDGNVEVVANKIHAQLNDNEAVVADITKAGEVDLENQDLLIIGGSTVGAEIWEEAKSNNKWNVFFKSLDSMNLKGKKIALFGLGDQVLYPGNFVDGLSVISHELENRGAKLIGAWPTEGYSFTDSTAVKDGKFLGLAIDEDHESDLTDDRIKNWLAQL